MTPAPSSLSVSGRMAAQRRRDTDPELAVRRCLHAKGLRYRVQYPVPGARRRPIDIAFTRARVAVFVDGCFWHDCPLHGTAPKSNPGWWADKLAGNRARDLDTGNLLAARGWTVLRFWEHEAASDVADEVCLAVSQRRTRSTAGIHRGSG